MVRIGAHLIEMTINQTARIQQIAAPTFREEKRAAYLLEEMIRLGMDEAFQDADGNVYARWRGGEQQPLILSAHLDSVHPAGLPLPLEVTTGKMIGPGVADNALGLAGLLALGKWLVESGRRFPGDIWLVADVGEEGLGNLAGMKAVVNRFGEMVKAYLVLEGLGLGQVCHRGLGVARYRITASTAGGHAWVNYGAPSAIHELAQVIRNLVELSLPVKPRTSLNVGIIQGGTSINTIASSASCELDLRSEDQTTLNRLIYRVKRVVAARTRKEAQIEMEVIGVRPAGSLCPSHPLVKLALECLADMQIPAMLETGSTDANVPLSRGIPAICLGLSQGGAPHTVHEYLEIPPIRLGLQQVMTIIERVWDRLPEKL